MSKKIILERYVNFFEPYYLDKEYIKSKKLSSFSNNGFEVFLGPDATHPGSITLRPKFRLINIEIQNILKEVFPSEIGLWTFYRVQDMDFAFECEVYDDKITHSPYNLFGTGSMFTGGGGGSYYYSIEEDTDLAPILEDHKYFMEKVTFPLFEKMSTLDGIDNFINGRILEGDMEYFMSVKRQMFLTKVNKNRPAFSGLIAAKINNKPYYDELINRYKAMFHYADYFLGQLEMLTKYLK